MTIADKSIELGIDLAQIALDKYGVNKCTNGETFKHFCSPEHGSNIKILDDNGEVIHSGYFRWSDDTLAESTTVEGVGIAFKEWLEGQEFIEMPVVDTYETTW